MFGSIVACAMLVCMVVYSDPTYAIAAGLFELSGVLYSVTRPRRLATAKTGRNDNA